MDTEDDNTTTEASTSDEQSLEQAIQLRAYEISQSGDAGTPEENWERAKLEMGV